MSTQTATSAWSNWALVSLTIVFGLLGLATLIEAQTEFSPVVQLKGGQVRGLVQEVQGHKLHFYQGIRYGRAERFRKPKAVEPWTGVYNATRPRFACPQLKMKYSDKEEDHHSNNSIQSNVYNEDCLFVNVWVPAEPKADRSVMFWIHGGAFRSGTIFSSTFQSHQISSIGDLIVVTVNYRLGPFGFLIGDGPDESGNSGLYDQILAMQWVQQNIRQFGGDPSKVTIFGQSAGGMSVGAQVLSPLTSGLFRRAIVQSGAPNGYSGSESSKVSLRKTVNFGHKLNCTHSDVAHIVRCLQAKPVQDIVAATDRDFENFKTFVPVYGGAHNKLLPVGPRHTLKHFESRQLDLMFGVVNNEGSLFVKWLFPQIDLHNITLQSARDGIKLFLNWYGVANASSVVDFYTHHLTHNSSKQELRMAVTDAYGDHRTVCPTIFFGQHLAQLNGAHGNSSNHFYSYRLTQKSQSSSCKQWMGVCHGEDRTFLFGQPITHRHSGQYSEADYQLSHDMILAWTQFANHGQIKPIEGSVAWSEALSKSDQEHNVHYMQLHSSHYKMVANYYRDRCEHLWKPLIDN